MRNLILVFGDQLDQASAAFDGFDTAQDAVVLIESREEATYIPQHKLRIAYFFAAMRNFRDALRRRGITVHYSALDDPQNRGAFAAELRRLHSLHKPAAWIALEPGDARVRALLEDLAFHIDQRTDRHFLCERRVFEDFLAEHPRAVMETFYRSMRRSLRILISPGNEPVGGAWNFDRDNRASLGRNPPPVPPQLHFPPTPATQQAIDLVRRQFPDAPGQLAAFDLPVTPEHAQAILQDFTQHRLPLFGRYQDAMHTGEPFLYHSRLSGPLNLHLIDPRTVLDAVLENPSDAPLNAVEGFVRQIIGWREFVHGLYWHHMPAYADLNALNAELPMPRFYWTGETDMRCLSEAIAHTLTHAYAHHIERLMVLGLYALLLGVHPYAVHQWHMSMFWDAVDWVSLPNTLGMSQYGDGGIIGTKPYVASGAYINRMSDHCRHCRYDPARATGENACPFTTLYWDFLARHDRRFRHNRRMSNMYANLDRRPDLPEIRRHAEKIRHLS